MQTPPPEPSSLTMAAQFERALACSSVPAAEPLPSAHDDAPVGAYL